MDPQQSDEQLFEMACKDLIDINNIRKILPEELIVSKSKKNIIGEGGQARVFKGEFEKQQVAVKVLSNIDWKSLSNELIIVSNLNHENIPKFYGIVIEKKYIQLVFQYIDGNTLDTFNVNKLDEKQKLHIAKSICNAIDYIYKYKFIHRDLKTENIMIDKNFHVYIIDFGISKVLTNLDTTKTRAIGSTFYVAPEVFCDGDYDDDDNYVSTITHKVDVWAFGCILSYLFSGYTPWTPKYMALEPVVQANLIKKVPFPIPDNIENKNIIKIIEMATVIDYTKRADITEIKKIMDKL